MVKYAGTPAAVRAAGLGFILLFSIGIRICLNPGLCHAAPGPRRAGSAALHSENWEERLAAVREISDESVLAGAAAADRDWDIRHEAFSGINDEALLRELAAGAECWSIRRRAVEKLEDERFIGRIAAEDGHWQVRLAAVELLENQALIAAALMREENREVAEAALDRISDEKLLGEAAAGAEYAPARLAAAERVMDGSILARLASEDADFNVRLEALGKIADRELFFKIALADEHPYVRRHAVSKTDDPSLLAEIALEDADAGVRREAVGRLEDEYVLLDVFLTDDCPRNRNAALKRISGTEAGSRVLGDNLVANPGFEDVGEDGSALNWSRTPDRNMEEGWVIDTLERPEPCGRFGKRSGRMKGITGSAYYLQGIRGVVPGEAYLFEVYAKAIQPEEREDTVVNTRVEWMGPETGRIRDPRRRHDRSLVARNEWERMQASAVAPEGADTARFFVFARNLGEEETVLFDNFSVRKIKADYSPED